MNNLKPITRTEHFMGRAAGNPSAEKLTPYQTSKSETNKTFSIEVGKDRSNKKAYVTMVYAKNN